MTETRAQPLFTVDDADYVRRCAEAVRNLIAQVATGADRSGDWCQWVPQHLDRLAERMVSDDR